MNDVTKLIHNAESLCKHLISIIDADSERWTLNTVINVVCLFAATSISSAKNAATTDTQIDKNQLFKASIDCFTHALKVQLEIT